MQLTALYEKLEAKNQETTDAAQNIREKQELFERREGEWNSREQTLTKELTDFQEKTVLLRRQVEEKENLVNDFTKEKEELLQQLQKAKDDYGQLMTQSEAEKETLRQRIKDEVEKAEQLAASKSNGKREEAPDTEHSQDNETSTDEDQPNEEEKRKLNHLTKQR